MASTLVSAAGPDASRAFRVPAASLTSAATVRRALAAASEEHAQAVIVPLSIAPPEEITSFDGVTELLREAHDGGMTTYVAVDVLTAAAADELPASRDHVVYLHPDWLMVPRELAPQMLGVDARSPAYLGEIARWSRAHGDRVSGLYVSPLDPAAAAYLASAVAAAVQRYAADGVYLDGIAFPGRDFDYSRHTLDVFRAHKRAELTAAERSRLDDIETIDPFAYPDEFPDDWSRFRELALTALVERIRASLPARPLLGAQVVDAEASLRDHFQDWRSWLDRGLVDRVGYRGAVPTSVVLSADGVRPSETPGSQSTAAVGVGTR